MKRLLASRGTPAAVVGVLALLVAGGGYALAGSSSAKTIHACVHKHGGGIYIAKKCARHDQKLSWNRTGPQGLPGQTGPQGPGATGLSYTVAGSATPTPTTIGTIGPYTLVGECTDTSGSDDFSITFSGPGTSVDGYSIMSGSSTNVFAESGTVPGPITNGPFGDSGSSTNQSVETGELLLIPTGSTPFQLFVSIVANGSSPVSGATANTCHLAATVTPISLGSSAPAAVDAARSGSARFSGPLLGKH